MTTKILIQLLDYRKLNSRKLLMTIAMKLFGHELELTEQKLKSKMGLEIRFENF